MKPLTVRARFVPPIKGHDAQQPKAPMVGAGSLIATRNGELREVITVRTYFNKKGSGMQPVRACVWITPAKDGPYLSGRGSASRCGYHKESAAIADAVSSAGVELFGELDRSYRTEPGAPVDYRRRVDFGGTGSNGYADVFRAIARAAGYRGRMLWVSHGL